jgi:hypothetical protein
VGRGSFQALEHSHFLASLIVRNEVPANMVMETGAKTRG